MKLKELMAEADRLTNFPLLSHGWARSAQKTIPDLADRLKTAVGALVEAQKSFDGPCVLRGRVIVHKKGCAPCAVFIACADINEGPRK